MSQSLGSMVPLKTLDTLGEQNDRPGVSVIIPAYNYAHFLPEAIESALSQSWDKVEIIVVDDGSTDNTPDVAARYGSHIRYIRQQNAGLPAARNTGIRAAKYPLIGFLDADDRWKPGFLSKAIECFTRHEEPYGIVASQAVYVDEHGQAFELKALTWHVHGRLNHRDILLKTRFSPSAVVARKAVLEEAGLFDESLRSSEDRDMWIRMAALKPVYLIPERLVFIRRHRHSMSRNAARMRENIFTVLEKSKAQGLVPADEWIFWLRAYSFAYFQSAWMYFEQGNRWIALRELALSCLFWPCHGAPNRLNEPILFRLRTCRQFLFTRSRI
jgi:glycosyltransferase involved in cell wall biosynthesis